MYNIDIHDKNVIDDHNKQVGGSLPSLNFNKDSKILLEQIEGN
jgi:hypothetical protein